jgi:hypothetical protein
MFDKISNSRNQIEATKKFNKPLYYLAHTILSTNHDLLPKKYVD